MQPAHKSIFPQGGFWVASATANASATGWIQNQYLFLGVGDFARFLVFGKYNLECHGTTLFHGQLLAIYRHNEWIPFVVFVDIGHDLPDNLNGRVNDHFDRMMVVATVIGVCHFQQYHVLSAVVNSSIDWVIASHNEIVWPVTLMTDSLKDEDNTALVRLASPVHPLTKQNVQSTSSLSSFLR